MVLRGRPFAVVAVVLLFIGSASAAPQQELPSSGETIDVSIVNVDVFVTDRQGRRVTGLTANDFEIRENGRLQPITNFAEYLPGVREATIKTAQGELKTTPAPPTAKRTILVFVERFSLPTFHTAPMFASIRNTLRSVVRPGDSAAVVFWDNDSAYPLQYFTDDVPSLEAALTEAERQSTGVSRPVLDDPLLRFEHKTGELQALMRSMSDVDGRKIVIFATNDFGIYPSTTGRAMGYAAMATHGSLATEKYRDALARTANEHGITIYPVFPVGLEWTSTTSAAESRPPAFVSRAAHDYGALINQTTALDELAKETGGLMAAGSSGIVSLLPRVVEDLNSYYSIAYRTPATGTTRSRDIAVKAKSRDYHVRSRREYVEKTDVTRMQDRVIANLYRPDGNGTIPVHVEVGKIDRTSRTHWSVLLRITVPVESLTTGPGGEGSFSIFVATGGMIGVMSDVQQHTQVFSAASIPSGREHFTYELPLTFNGATNIVSVGVMDAGSKDFGLKTVDLPAYRTEDGVGGE